MSFGYVKKRHASYSLIVLNLFTTPITNEWV